MIAIEVTDDTYRPAVCSVPSVHAQHAPSSSATSSDFTGEPRQDEAWRAERGTSQEAYRWLCLVGEFGVALP